MDLLYYLHVVIIFAVMSIPFWTIRYLRYGIYIPILLATLWLICGGCPISHWQGIKDTSFIQTFIQDLFPSISLTDNQSVKLSYYVLLLITIVGAVRLQMSDCPKSCEAKFVNWIW